MTAPRATPTPQIPQPTAEAGPSTVRPTCTSRRPSADTGGPGRMENGAPRTPRSSASTPRPMSRSATGSMGASKGARDGGGGQPRKARSMAPTPATSTAEMRRGGLRVQPREGRGGGADGAGAREAAEAAGRLTVSPQMSKRKRSRPMTPATTGPTWTPTKAASSLRAAMPVTISWPHRGAAPGRPGRPQSPAAPMKASPMVLSFSTPCRAATSSSRPMTCCRPLTTWPAVCWTHQRVKPTRSRRARPHRPACERDGAVSRSSWAMTGGRSTSSNRRDSASWARASASWARARPGPASEVGPDAGEQEARADRLVDVVHAAHGEAALLGGLGVSPRDEDDGTPGRRGAPELQVSWRPSPAYRHRAGRGRAGACARAPGLVPASGHADANMRLEERGQRRQVDRLVIDDEDEGGGAGAVMVARLGVSRSGRRGACPVRRTRGVR